MTLTGDHDFGFEPRPLRTAVVGHTEWVDFVRVERVPEPGQIVHALDFWQEPGGGGAVAAVQLLKLAGNATFFTAFSEESLGHFAHAHLQSMGLRLEAVFRPTPQRRAITHIDAGNERTITVLGERLAPHGTDLLDWTMFEEADVVYLTAGDQEAVHIARRASILVATTRILSLLAEAHVHFDAVIGSARDESERYETGDLDPPPTLAVRTEGSRGGTFQVNGERWERYEAAEIPGPSGDSYGCGDSFAAGLTFALGCGAEPRAAVAFAARCGASTLTGKGPYEGQLQLV